MNCQEDGLTLIRELSEKEIMAQAIWESRPDEGSSRNKSRAGFAASSTPIVSSFRCSTLSPSPGTPTTASAKSPMSSMSITFSTYSSSLWRTRISAVVPRSKSEELLVRSMSLMEILLLHVPCLSLETRVESFPVHKHVTSHNTNRLSLRKHVQKSRLPSA